MQRRDWRRGLCSSEECVSFQMSPNWGLSWERPLQALEIFIPGLDFSDLSRFLALFVFFPSAIIHRAPAVSWALLWVSVVSLAVNTGLRMNRIGDHSQGPDLRGQGDTAGHLSVSPMLDPAPGPLHTLFPLPRSPFPLACLFSLTVPAPHTAQPLETHTSYFLPQLWLYPVHTL